MNDVITPVIENLNVVEQSVDIWARMTLAGVFVSVGGSYHIDSNCFYPSEVMDLKTSEFFDLEDYCEKMGWDYYDTHDAIQQAVEHR